MNFPDPTGERPGTRCETAALKMLMRRKRAKAGIKRFANRQDALADRLGRKRTGAPRLRLGIIESAAHDDWAQIMQLLDRMLSLFARERATGPLSPKAARGRGRGR